MTTKDLTFKNGYLVGQEIFIPETKEVWVKSNGEFVFINGNETNWDTEGLKLQEVEIPSEVQGLTTVKGYVYELQPGDYDEVDIESFIEKFHW